MYAQSTCDDSSIYIKRKILIIIFIIIRYDSLSPLYLITNQLMILPIYWDQPLYLITNQLMILPIYWDQHIQIGTESTSNEVTPCISTSPI